MNRKVIIALSLLTFVLACNKEKQTVTPQTTPVSTETVQTTHHSGSRGSGSLFIPMADANQMISSYIASIASDPNNTAQTPDIHSFSVNADSLRAYLANPAIKSVKLAYAHTMEYINAGNYGIMAGYQSAAMTIIVAGYDANGNYVYFSGANGSQLVLDHLVPCPSNCPNGAAGNDLLQ